MDILLKPEFWAGQVAGALQHWAVAVPLLLLALFVGWKLMHQLITIWM